MKNLTQEGTPLKYRSGYVRFSNFMRDYYLFVIIGLVLSFIGFTFVREQVQDRQDEEWARPFLSKLEEYKAICIESNIALNRESKPAKAPRLTGKLVVMGVMSYFRPDNEYKLTKYYWKRVPDDLLARNPDEVGAILLAVSFPASRVGKYRSGGTAYEGGSMSFEVIDVKRKQRIGVMSRSGGSPPTTKYYGGNAHGSPAHWPRREELESFLRSLQ